MKTTFIPTGVCSKQFDIELEDGIIKDLVVTGGCNGNLQGIAALVKGKPAEEVIPLLRGIKCRIKDTSCPDQISIALEEALKAEKPVYSSSSEFDMDKEYMFQTYKMLQKDKNPEFGVESSKDVVIRLLNFDQLNYMFHSEGTHMVLFGGTWSKATCSVIDQVNFYARKYGIEEVYMYDFTTDGTAETTIKQDIRAHAAYVGPDKKPENAFAIYNYLYGEICSRHLTNLNDWVANKVGSGNDITYLNRYQDVVTVPNLTEPFLFIYDKNNTVDNSGAARSADYVNEKGTYPIVRAIEIKAFRGEDGKFYSDENLHVASTYLDNFGAQLDSKFFSFIEKDNLKITSYTQADYIIDAFRVNGRGHSYKTEDAFEDGEQINIHAVNYQEFKWLINQKGNFILYLAGPWCAFSQGGIPTVNDYAVANNLQVYMMDSRFDSKHAIDFWFYPRKNEYKLSSPACAKYYVELWEEYFPCAEIMCKKDPSRHWDRLTIDYTDENGKLHSPLTAGIPFLMCYNKDHVNWKGQKHPIIFSKHDAGELINCSEVYVYYKPVFHNYKAGVYSVFCSYCQEEGIEFNDITIDRTKPRVEGTPEKHPETVAYHKEYDWYQDSSAFGGPAKPAAPAAAAPAKAASPASAPATTLAGPTASSTSVIEDDGCC